MNDVSSVSAFLLCIIGQELHQQLNSNTRRAFAPARRPRDFASAAKNAAAGNRRAIFILNIPIKIVTVL